MNYASLKVVYFLAFSAVSLKIKVKDLSVTLSVMLKFKLNVRS